MGWILLLEHPKGVNSNKETVTIKEPISRKPTAEDYLEMISTPSWVISTMYSI